MSFLQRVGGVACAALILSTLIVPEFEAAEQSPKRLTLQQAVEGALARSPALRVRMAEVEQAESRLLTARTYLFNPEIGVEGARRSNVGSTTDREVRIGQEFEIGGQRRRRTGAASAELDASRSGLLREERLLVARVRAVFVEALRTRELRNVEQANTELARSLSDIAHKRFESGATAQMEVNLARVQAGRAERDLLLAEAADDVARAVLAEVVGLDPVQPPELDGDLDLQSRQIPPLSEFLKVALERRGDLQSFRSSIEAARVQIELARRRRVPNLEVEAFYGREDRTDRLVGGEIRIRLPIFNRNQGEIAEARATYRRTEAESETKEIQVRRESTAALSRYRAAHAASSHLEQEVLGTLEDNLRLLQRSFEAGKTGWAELLVFRREFVDVQREYIETRTDARLAGIEIDLASGVNPFIPQKESQP